MCQHATSRRCWSADPNMDDTHASACNQPTMLERNQHATRDAIRLACSRKFASHGVDATVESKRGILSRVACKQGLDEASC